MQKIFHSHFVGFLVLAFAVGCAQQETQEQDTQSDPQIQQEVEQTMNDASSPEHSEAVAVIHPTEGNEVSGTVTFTAAGDSVQVQAEISGLSEGNHGFHIHQYGDCTAPDGSSAGGHFNPDNNDHAGPTDSPRHMGDMGNIEADAEGNATLNYGDSTISIDQILGRAVVVHGGEDDLESQPSGDAGPRIGCGVIGVANTGSM